MSRRFTILIATLLLVFLQNPAWASLAIGPSIEDIIFYLGVIMIPSLLGAVVGAYMAFSPGRYWKCFYGAFKGGLRVTILISVCAITFKWMNGMEASVSFYDVMGMAALVTAFFVVPILPVIVLVVILPTSGIIYAIRSRSNKNKQKLADEQNPEQVAEGNDGD